LAWAERQIVLPERFHDSAHPHPVRRYLEQENARRRTSETSREGPLRVESQQAFNWMVYTFGIKKLRTPEDFLYALQTRYPNAPTAAELVPLDQGVASGEVEEGALPAYVS